MHNPDDKYPPRPGLEPGTPRLQAPVDTNEPSGPARKEGGKEETTNQRKNERAKERTNERTDE